MNKDRVPRTLHQRTCYVLKMSNLSSNQVLRSLNQFSMYPQLSATPFIRLLHSIITNPVQQSNCGPVAPQFNGFIGTSVVQTSVTFPPKSGFIYPRVSLMDPASHQRPLHLGNRKWWSRLQGKAASTQWQSLDTHIYTTRAAHRCGERAQSCFWNSVPLHQIQAYCSRKFHHHKLLSTLNSTGGAIPEGRQILHETADGSLGGESFSSSQRRGRRAHLGKEEVPKLWQSLQQAQLQRTITTGMNQKP